MNRIHRKQTAVLVGVFLIVVAGVGMITIGGVADDNPFSVGNSSTDASTASGSEGIEDEEGTSGDEENSARLPPTTTESSDDQSEDDQIGDNQTDDDQTEDNQTEDDQIGDNQTEDNQTEDSSGVNFASEVRNFEISTEEFEESSLDVEDGYVTPGEHRLLRFDMIIHNVGYEDAELGYPEDNPDIFKPSESHNHYHLKDFVEYKLYDESDDEVAVERKQAFCLRDDFQTRSNANSSAQFNCDYQGISAGWADLYPASLPGQYLVIGDLPDGEYTLQATTNPEGTIDEKCDSNNSHRVGLRIENNTVTSLDSQTPDTSSSAC